jgi:hypothetical protein
MSDAEYKMNLIVYNYPITLLKPFLYPMQNNIKYTNLEDKNKLYKYIINNEDLNKIMNADIYSNGTVLEKLIKLSKLDKSSQDYKLLYQDIIKVGEYNL